MTWRRLEAAAPELARRGRERLEAAGVALLGSLRRDGSPRISPVEPRIAGGELVFGAMAWSAKARDLLRDDRCVLHSAVAAPDAGEPELKLYGRARELRDAAERDAAAGAWWVGRPVAAARVFALEVERAVFVEWDLEHGEATFTRWSPREGVVESRRPYP